MTNFDPKKFLDPATTEQEQRKMIAEVVQKRPWKHKVDTDFRILAFELRDKVDRMKYHEALGTMIGQHWSGLATSLEMIAAALMAWPESEGK